MPDCPFCALAAGCDDDLLVVKTPSVIVVPALKQRLRNRGHMLVLPTAHITRIVDAEPSLVRDLYTVAGGVAVAVRTAFDATGVTYFQNESSPDQVLLHMHLHVVPRRRDDRFMLPDPASEELSRDTRVAQSLAVRRALESHADEGRTE